MEGRPDHRVCIGITSGDQQRPVLGEWWRHAASAMNQRGAMTNTSAARGRGVAVQLPQDSGLVGTRQVREDVVAGVCGQAAKGETERVLRPLRPGVLGLGPGPPFPAGRGRTSGSRGPHRKRRRAMLGQFRVEEHGTALEETLSSHGPLARDQERQWLPADRR